MRLVNGDWWPDRDHTCHKVCYDLRGADLAASICLKHDLVIQAGGNVGVWPKYLRETFANVWTFEPSRENYEFLLKNLSGIDVRSWNAALGEKRGQCSMKLNPLNCGDDRTVPGKDIEVIAIDDLGVDPDLIYLDVQGDELAALLGAEETLKRCKPIVAIEHEKHCVKARGDPIPFLQSVGYRRYADYRQDLIFSARKIPKREKPAEPLITKFTRKFKTLADAIAAMTHAPEGIVVDKKRMTWRHKNGAKTHFVVGD